MHRFLWRTQRVPTMNNAFCVNVNVTPKIADVFIALSGAHYRTPRGGLNSWSKTGQIKPDQTLSLMKAQVESKGF